MAKGIVIVERQEQSFYLGAPEIPPPPSPEHKYTLEQIHQSGDMLKISGGEAGTTTVYSIDPTGNEVSDAIPDAPGSVRVAKTRWDDGKLVTEWKLQRNGETFMHGTDVHSLTPDGQLIVTRVIESPRHKADGSSCRGFRSGRPTASFPLV